MPIVESNTNEKQKKTYNRVQDLCKYFRTLDLDICKRDLSLGRTYKYSLDKSYVKLYLKGNRFIFQTPPLFIPYEPRPDKFHKSGDHVVEAVLFNVEHDPDTKAFIDWIEQLELLVYKCLKKRPYLGVKKSRIIPILKNDEYRTEHKKMRLRLDSKYTDVYGVGPDGRPTHRIDYRNSGELKIPCYAVFIIEIQTIWIRKETTSRFNLDDTTENIRAFPDWGLSLTTHAVQCMPTHNSITPITFTPNDFQPVKWPSSSSGIPPPPPPPPPPLNLSVSAANDGFPDGPEYDKYRRMKKLGIPMDAIKHKMKMEGLQMLDTTGERPKITSNMLQAVKLKTMSPEERAKQEEERRQMRIKRKVGASAGGQFTVSLDQLLSAKSRLKKSAPNMNDKRQHNIDDEELNPLFNDIRDSYRKRHFRPTIRNPLCKRPPSSSDESSNTVENYNIVADINTNLNSDNSNCSSD